MSDLIKALQQAMELAEKVATVEPVVTQAVENVTSAVTGDAPIPPEQQAASQVTPTKVSDPSADTFDKVVNVVNDVATVAGFIPGLQASHLVELLTHATALVNTVEKIKTHVQQHAPGEWAQIESVFSGAVGAFHSIPKA